MTKTGTDITRPTMPAMFAAHRMLRGLVPTCVTA